MCHLVFSVVFEIKNFQSESCNMQVKKHQSDWVLIVNFPEDSFGSWAENLTKITHGVTNKSHF